MMLTYLFPGQGAQVPGMGLDLYERYPLARDRFRQATALTGLDLAGLCFGRDAARLRATEHAQPAMFLLGTIIAELLAGIGLRPALAGGHSVGEFAALVAAGALSFEDGIRLVAARGRLMAEAGRKAPGTMTAISGLDLAAVEAVVAEAAGNVWVANVNAARQVVVAGDAAGVQAASAIARRQGGQAVPLNVSGAFHSPLLESAGAAFAGLVDAVPLAAPAFGVVGNVTGAFLTTADAVREELRHQLTAPVQWVRCLESLNAVGAGPWVEAGPGKVMRGLLLQHRRDVTVHAAGTAAQIGRLAAELAPAAVAEVV